MTEHQIDKLIELAPMALLLILCAVMVFSDL